MWLQSPMRYQPPYWERLQGAAPLKWASHFTGQADARRRARERPIDLLKCQATKQMRRPVNVYEIRVQSQSASEIFTQSLHYLYAPFKKMSYYLNTKSLMCGAGHRLWCQAIRENV
jgi:hypothetical protein